MKPLAFSIPAAVLGLAACMGALSPAIIGERGKGNFKPPPGHSRMAME